MGHAIAEDKMNIEELKGILNLYDSNAQVMVTWESIFCEIDVDSIYKAPNGVIVIDADGNFYKERIVSGDLIPK